MELIIKPTLLCNDSEENLTSSYPTNETLSSSSFPLSHVGNRGGSCYVNGTREYEEFYRTAQFVTGLIIYPILCVIGIIGNSLSLIVLSHRDMATSTNVYLLALGVSDSLKLLNDFLYFIMLVISLTNPRAAETMMVNVYPYAHYVFQVAVCVTAWLTVSVAMDRYVSVCHPPRAKSLCTIVRARSMVLTVFLVMMFISIPSVFRYRLQTVFDNDHNTTCMELVVTELGRNKEFMIPYTWAQNFLRGIIPVFILIFLNLRIINVLRKERVKGKKFTARNRITLMLIAMILVFIICITPDAIMSTFFGKGYVEEGFMVKAIREITDSLLALNSAVNFILYCSLSNLFRATFAKVFIGKHYIRVKSGSVRQIVSTYAVAESPTVIGQNANEGDSFKRKNSGSGSKKNFRFSRKGTLNSNGKKTMGDSRNDNVDSPESIQGLIDEALMKNNYPRERNNSLCYTDDNDHLYAEMSGVWLGPAPKSLAMIPKNTNNKTKADNTMNLCTDIDISRFFKNENNEASVNNKEEKDTVNKNERFCREKPLQESGQDCEHPEDLELNHHVTSYSDLLLQETDKDSTIINYPMSNSNTYTEKSINRSLSNSTLRKTDPARSDSALNHRAICMNNSSLCSDEAINQSMFYNSISKADVFRGDDTVASSDCIPSQAWNSLETKRKCVRGQQRRSLSATEIHSLNQIFMNNVKH